jgi:hypothetical protein
VSLRALVSVSGLTFGDYLLWNWSLNANHDVIALASGLTLPPLALALLWLLALSIARLLAHTTRAGSHRRRRPSASRSSGSEGPAARTQEPSGAREQSPRRSSGKIAA